MQETNKFIDYEYEIVTKNLNISSIFNMITPSKEVPFISWNNFTKLYRDFSLPQENEFTNKESEFIRFTYENPNNIRTPSRITKRTENSFVLGFKVTNDSLTLKEMLKLASNLLKFEINSENLQIVGRKSLFTVFNQTFEMYIIKDLITNDSELRKKLYINELLKSKRGTYFTIGFREGKNSFKFIMRKEKEKKCNSVTFVVKNSDDPTYVKLLTDYIGTFLKLYNERAPSIREQYIKLGMRVPDLEQNGNGCDTTVSVVRGKAEKCSHHATKTTSLVEAMKIVNETPHLVTQLEKNDISTLILDHSEIDGYFYTCPNHDKNPYPGLTKADNIPCCYKTVYQPDKVRTFIVSNPPVEGYKILLENQFGNLPSNVEEIFNFFLSEPTDQFLRRGVAPTNRSLIDCVYPNEPQKLINAMQKKAVLAKQEMYDYSIEEIQEIISNGFIDASLFYSLVEEALNINLFVFTSSGILIPRHKNGYFKRQKTREKSCILYEQIDNRFKFKRYEIIYKNGSFIHLTESRLIKFCFKLFYESLKTFGPLDGLIPVIQPFQIMNMDKTQVVLTDDEIILNQLIDSSGKARMLRTNKRQLKIFPCQPFNCEARFISPGESVLATYRKTERDARCLIDYVLWLYTNTNSENVYEFISERTIVKEGHSYENKNPVFGSNKNGFLIKDLGKTKLVLTSLLVQKRITDILQLLRIENKNYKKINVLPNFYKHLFDFDMSESFNLFEGDVGLDCIRENVLQTNVLQDTMGGDKRTLFQNDDVSMTKMFLSINNHSTLENSVKDFDKATPIPPMNEPIGVYSYFSNYNIRLINNKPDLNFNILAKKEMEEISFSTLVPVPI
jgi:hypothetical protein